MQSKCIGLKLWKFLRAPTHSRQSSTHFLSEIQEEWATHGYTVTTCHNIQRFQRFQRCTMSPCTFTSANAKKNTDLTASTGRWRNMTWQSQPVPTGPNHLKTWAVSAPRYSNATNHREVPFLDCLVQHDVHGMSGILGKSWRSQKAMKIERLLSQVFLYVLFPIVVRSMLAFPKVLVKPFVRIFIMLVNTCCITPICILFTLYIIRSVKLPTQFKKGLYHIHA